MTRRKRPGRGLGKTYHSARVSAGPSSERRKFYAVRAGRDGFCGVVNSWDECQFQISGVSGVAFKSFRTYDEASAFAQNKPLDVPFTKPTKKKFYAVRYNGYSGVFTSWDECKLHVHGRPNATYKSFRTLREAEEFAHGGDAKPETHSGSAAGIAGEKVESPDEVVEPFQNTTEVGQDATGKGDPPLTDVGIAIEEIQYRQAPQEHLVVFTDGACINNGRPNSRAGYGVFFGEGSPLNISKPLPGKPTNQRAEMMAVLIAIRTALKHGLVSRGGILEIRTDSQYTKNGVDKWVDGWKKKNWKTAAGTDVKNKDLWIALDAAKLELLESGVMFHLVWVKGHAGNPGNEAADQLAVAGIYEM